jgi:cysteinyl-tRNA synthetase
MLQIYNSLTHKKEIFHPIIPGKIKMYVCGMTVYDFCHLGHARVLVSFDVIVRYLKSQGFDVTYVRNITDVDDKIINRANEAGEEISVLTDRFIRATHEDENALNVQKPTVEPRATHTIPEMIALTQKLLDKGFAYVASDGDVYYDVSQFSKYGCLAHQDLEKLRAGARVAVADAKQDALDFVLWKIAKPGEPSWESPWGAVRPGWHLECSAMAMQHLGEHFDIHGGGHDLLFPHHENEIAQSEAATGKTFVNTWMHVGFLQINKEKMSKSLGNFLTIREALASWPAEVVRYFLLASHYRSQLNYSDDSLEGARKALERFYLSLRGLDYAEPVQGTAYEERFNAAMDDDFNTPEALAVLFELAREINRLRTHNVTEASQFAALLRKLSGIFGILQQDPEAFLQGADDEQIDALVKQRVLARKNKDWAESDRLRDQLKQLGIILEDTPDDTVWRRE